MAARFAIGTGTWSSTGTWSTTSGGATGAAVPTNLDDVTLDSHTTALTIDAASTCKTFTEAAGFVGTVTHNAFVLTVAGNITFIAGSTYTPLATSTLTLSATATLTTGTLLMPLITVTTGTLTLGDNLTFMASKVMTLTLTGALNLGGKTLSGQSITNRVLLQSNTPGTSRTVTTTGPNFANCDYQDIQFSCASNLDLSAITGKSGDCLGNTLTGGGATLTFTPAAPQVCTMSTNQNASTLAIWTSRVPLPQDNVSYAGVSGGILTQDMPRIGATVDWTGATGSKAWTFTVTNSIYGSVTLVAGMTLTGIRNLLLGGRSAQTITTAGNTWPGLLFVQAPGGTYTQQDAYSGSSYWEIDQGGWVANNFNVTARQFFISGIAPKTVDMGTGVWTALTASVNEGFINTGGAGLTFSGASSTIVFATATTAALRFNGGTFPYGTVQYTVAKSPGPLFVTFPATTFGTLLIGSGRTLIFNSGVTFTIASGGTFNVNGSAFGYQYQPGVSGAYISVPDTAALDITGNLTLEAQIGLASWSAPAAGAIVSKFGAAGSKAYSLQITAAGKLTLTTSVDGTATILSTSSVATGSAANTIQWVRATLTANDGAAHNVVKFWTSPDRVTWTQLGTTVTNAGATSIFNAAQIVEIGSTATGTLTLFVGQLYRVAIAAADLGSGSGTYVADWNFITKTVGANTLTDSINSLVATINGTLAQVGDGRVAITASTPASAATLAGTATQLQNCDYLTLQDSTATPSGVFFAGHHSTSVSNVTGWTLATGFMQTLTATQPRTATALKQVGKTLTASQSSTAALTKQGQKLLTAAQGSTAGMVRLTGKVVSATQATSAGLTKLASHSIAAVQGSSAALTRTTSKTLAALQPTTAALVKQAGKSLAGTQPSTASVGRIMSVLLASTQSSAAAVVKRTALVLAATQPQTAGMTKSVATTLTATQSTAAGIGKSIGKLLAAVGSSIAGILTHRQQWTVPETTDYQATTVTTLDTQAAALTTGDFSQTDITTGDFQQT